MRFKEDPNSEDLEESATRFYGPFENILVKYTVGEEGVEVEVDGPFPRKNTQFLCRPIRVHTF